MIRVTNPKGITIGLPYSRLPHLLVNIYKCDTDAQTAAAMAARAAIEKGEKVTHNGFTIWQVPDPWVVVRWPGEDREAVEDEFFSYTLACKYINESNSEEVPLQLMRRNADGTLTTEW